MQKLWTLIRTEFVLDFRDRFTVGSLLLYASVTAFITLIALQEPETEVWNVLYWILLSFSAVISGLNMYVREAGDHRLYYYQLAKPEEIYLAKWIAQLLMISFLSIVLYGVMAALSHSPVILSWKFALVLLLGSVSLSSVLCFTAAISALSQGPAVLLSILSFPLLIPVLLLLQYTSGVTMDVYLDDQYWQYVMYLLAISLICTAAGLFLINFVWRN